MREYPECPRLVRVGEECLWETLDSVEKVGSESACLDHGFQGAMRRSKHSHVHSHGQNLEGSVTPIRVHITH